MAMLVYVSLPEGIVLLAHWQRPAITQDGGTMDPPRAGWEVPYTSRGCVSQAAKPHFPWDLMNLMWFIPWKSMVYPGLSHENLFVY